MRMRLRSAALMAIAGALTAGTVTPAAATPGARTSSWSVDLAAGEPAGVDVAGGTAVLDPAGTFLAPTEDGPLVEGGPVTAGNLVEGSPVESGTSVPTGLLTLPTHRLDAPADRIDTAVAAELPTGSTATMDIRSRRATGSWTEWIPATPTVTLPEPAVEVQSRLVLTGTPGAEPAVSDVTLTAHPATRAAEPITERAPLSYRVFATREGLVGGTTANGHVIVERDHFVALPSRRALSPRGTSDYSVKVCAPNGRCAFAPVWDVGPWNTRDDYWNPAAKRQEWADLPQGVPQAQAAYRDGYHGGRDQYDRKVANPAGIDLGDGLFWDALGLKDNSMVTVDYLWTGNVRLSTVFADDPVDVLAAPDAAAEVVGTAAGRAAVPVECMLTAEGATWLRIGTDQYLDADAVPAPGPVGACDEPAPAPTNPSDPGPAGAAPGSTDPGSDVPDGPDAAAAEPGVTAPGSAAPSTTAPSTNAPSTNVEPAGAAVPGATVPGCGGLLPAGLAGAAPVDRAGVGAAVTDVAAAVTDRVAERLAPTSDG